MPTSSWQRPKDLFQAALERPPEERCAFLDTACAGDEELRREVESLLAAHDQAGDFLSRPAAVDGHDHRDDGSLAAVPQRVGPYRILDTIAQGGMGTVYRAVRDDDTFQKTVALKLLRAGRGSAPFERRFRQERQILARLQHPNIATVLDGGTSDRGEPYLVMEHVEGLPITDHCAVRSLSTRERVDLFRVVCGAVHYAHQNLVVHRDIKPANVLVDGRGVPKLLDFGIAKLLAAGIDPDEAPTATVLPMMTPEYASPEQVKGLPVTTASDVYSLGVLLYELLTGRRPYEVKADSLEAIVRAVCETQPKAPSATTGEGRSRSAARSGALPRASELRGDLDTIVLEALRKEPERRYPSARELSEDLRRYLEGLPVKARADTIGYVAGKFVRRHRAAAAATALVLLSLVAGIVATARQARIAEANRERAERRFADVRRLAASLVFDLHDEIRDLPGATRARERLVVTAQEYLDGLAREAAGDVELQRELASAYERLGDVQGGALSANLGNIPGALESYSKAAAIRESLADAADAGSRDEIDLARLQVRRGNLLRGMGRLAEAEPLFRDVAEQLEAIVTAGEAPDDAHRGLAVAYASWASVLIALGRAEESGPALQKAIEYGEAFAREHPDDGAAQANLANSYYSASLDARSRGAHAEALDLVRRARAIQEERHRRSPLDQSVVRSLLFSLNGEGLHLGSLDQRREAVDVHRHALELALDMLNRDPEDRWAQAAVTVAYGALGESQVQVGEPTAGLDSLRRGRAIAARLIAADPANGFVRNELAVIDTRIGFALLEIGSPTDAAEACRSFTLARDSLRELQKHGPLTADSAAALLGVDSELARCG